MSRQLGNPNAHTRKLHRTVKEIISEEQYAELVLDLYRQAMQNKDERVAFAAKKLIIEYMEGKPREQVEHTIHSGLTVGEVLSGLVEEKRTDTE